MKRQYFLIVAISLFVAADRAGAGTNSALDFAPKTTGTTEDSYVSVANSAKLGLSTFTIEARFIMQPNGRRPLSQSAHRRYPWLLRAGVNAMTARRT
jgi:hypothetical protein